MDFDEVCKVGQWLRFRADTCFGKNKDHLGLLVAINDELAISIAINATSNVEGVKNFASRRCIDFTETVIVVRPNTPQASLHFSKETAFDCNRPSIIQMPELRDWVRRQKIETVNYNIEVNQELLQKIKKGIIKSPLVPQKYKNLMTLD